MSRNKTDSKLSDKAAEDLQNVIVEARSWIEAVTGRTLDKDFRQSLENGVILCELINSISPNTIRKINRKQIAIAHLDNLKQFLNSCESLGLKDSQLFNVTDLQDPGTLRSRSGGVKHTTADRRLRNVCITLYWLGRRVSQLPAYKGPQLNLDAFRELLDIPQPQSYQLLGYETEQPPPTQRQHRESPNITRAMMSPDRESPNMGGDRITPTIVSNSRTVMTATVAYSNNAPSFPTFEATGVTSPTISMTTPTTMCNGTSSLSGNHEGVTNELDTLADQLLANIQSAVDDLIIEYGSNDGDSDKETTQPISSADLKADDNDDDHNDSPPPSPTSIHKTINIISPNGSFGLQLIGGTNTTLPAQVEIVFPGLPAETSGIAPGDLIVSVDNVDVTNMTHDELISQIKSCAVNKRMSLGIVRRIKTELDDIPIQKFERTESSILWEEEHKERDRQREEVARIYKGNSQSSGSNNDDDDDIDDLDVNIGDGTHWNMLQGAEKRGMVSEPVLSNHVELSYNGVPEDISDEETTPNEATPNETTPNESDIEQERGEGEGREADTESEGLSTEPDPFLPIDKPTDQSSYLLSEVISSSKYSKISSNSTYSSKTTPITSKTTHSSSTLPANVSPPTKQSNTVSNVREVGTIGEEEIIGNIKAKTVNRTRWTPENSRANVNRSASLLNSNGGKYSNGDGQNDYERHEVVMSDPRDARARSWSYHGAQDASPSLGVRPTSGDRKRLSCSHCRAPITHGPMMSIEAKDLNFHARCLQCVVCRTKLTPGYGRTTVYLRHSLPHCSSCYSTDNGIKTTTC